MPIFGTKKKNAIPNHGVIFLSLAKYRHIVELKAAKRSVVCISLTSVL